MLTFDEVDEARTTEQGLIRLKKLASVGRLSANLIHELNNPLDGARRYASLLFSQTPEDDPKRVYIKEILDGLVRLTNMVREMLDFTRKSRMMSSPTKIPHSIRRILSSFDYQISSQNIKVKTQFSENIPVILNVDVEQIFTNIIKNAIQAMPDGGVLSIDASMPLPKLLETRFSDTGSGIPDEALRAVFQPFYTTTRPPRQSTGLGLFISNEIAKSYGGSIDVESNLDKGTTFIVRLPISENGLTAISR